MAEGLVGYSLWGSQEWDADLATKERILHASVHRYTQGQQVEDSVVTGNSGTLGVSLGQQGSGSAEGSCVTPRRVVSPPLRCCELVLSRSCWGSRQRAGLNHRTPGHTQKQLCAAPHPWGDVHLRELGAKVFGSRLASFG